MEAAFYGGSFTALPVAEQRSYLEAVQPFIASGSLRTIRISTRPDSINDEILALLSDHHVSIVELGAQSMDDAVLAASGRGHSAEDTRRAAALLRERGFRVGLQLMLGLPEDTPERFAVSVNHAIRLQPDFVRLYPTVVVLDTPLARLYEMGRYAPLLLDDAVSWCADAVTCCTSSGIPVIRIGLQATETLQQPGALLAGPFHPAFGQLVESALYLRKLRSALSVVRSHEDTAIIAVHRQDVSTAIGQRRTNIVTLKQEFNLRQLIIRPDVSMTTRGAPMLVDVR